jgi:hypothetical protein
MVLPLLINLRSYSSNQILEDLRVSSSTRSSNPTIAMRTTNNSLFHQISTEGGLDFIKTNSNSSKSPCGKLFINVIEGKPVRIIIKA